MNTKRWVGEHNLQSTCMLSRCPWGQGDIPGLASGFWHPICCPEEGSKGYLTNPRKAWKDNLRRATRTLKRLALSYSRWGQESSGRTEGLEFFSSTRWPTWFPSRTGSHRVPYWGQMTWSGTKMEEDQSRQSRGRKEKIQIKVAEGDWARNSKHQLPYLCIPYKNKRGSSWG